MKRLISAALLLGVAALTGCAQINVVSPRGTTVLQPLEVRANPRVTVENGRIVVKPEILVFGNREGPVTITWRLPKDSAYRFTRVGGVVIEGELLDKVIRNKDGRAEGVVLDPAQQEVVDCKIAEDGLTASCVNRNTRPFAFKYTLRVSDGKTTIERDPPAINGDGM